MKSESSEQNAEELSVEEIAEAFDCLTTEYNAAKGEFLKITEGQRPRYIQRIIEYKDKYHDIRKKLNNVNGASSVNSKKNNLNRRILERISSIKEVILETKKNTKISHNINIPTVKNTAFFKQIGNGGQATVYKLDLKSSGAHKQSLELPITIVKVSRNESENDFIDKEAELLGEIEHKNIISVIYSGKVLDIKLSFIALEYMVNGDLEQKIEGKKDKLSVNHRLTIARKVIKALCYLSKKNIIHHDVKIGNILLGRNQRVKLADFGLAKVTKSCKCLAGAPYCAAPEVSSKKRHNHLIDMFGFGLVIWSLAHDLGYSAWDSVEDRALGPLEMICMISYTEKYPKINPVSENNSEIETFITSCLSRDPRKRMTPVEAEKKLLEITAKNFECTKPSSTY